MEQFEIGDKVTFFEGLKRIWKPGEIVDKLGTVYGVYSKEDNCTYMRPGNEIRKVS